MSEIRFVECQNAGRHLLLTTHRREECPVEAGTLPEENLSPADELARLIQAALRASYEAGRMSGRYVAGEDVEPQPLRDDSDAVTVSMWRKFYDVM